MCFHLSLTVVIVVYKWIAYSTSGYLIYSVSASESSRALLLWIFSGRIEDGQALVIYGVSFE